VVAKGGPRTRSCNAGELDPALAGAVDIKQYYSGGLKYRNVEPVPQAGFRQMPGTHDIGRVRRRVYAIAASDLYTNFGPHAAGEHIVYQIAIDDDVCAVTVEGIAVDTGDHFVACEVLSGGVWVQIGPQIGVGTAARTQTFARAPGDDITGATAIRLRMTITTTAEVSLAGVGPRKEGLTVDTPRYCRLIHESGEHYWLSFGYQFVDIYSIDSFVGAVDYTGHATVAFVPEIGFFAENAVVGVFHRDFPSQMIRRAGSAQEWICGDWPYDGLPEVDLGGSYLKTNDAWEIWLTWPATSSSLLYLSVTVEGETAETVVLKDAGGDPEPIDGTPVWATLVSELQAALQALPGMIGTVNVQHQIISGTTTVLTVQFMDAAAGREFQLDAMITNTADIAALPVHLVKGATTYEPLFSASRGWPGVVGMVQDRLAYGDVKSEPSAVVWSQQGEYFRLGLSVADASAAIADRLRTSGAAERVLAIMEVTFPLIFTNQRVYFTSNREIKATEPRNYTVTSDLGIVQASEPCDIGERVFYVATNENDPDGRGHQVVSLGYDEIASRFTAKPESLMAAHLVQNIRAARKQKSSAGDDVSRFWQMRDDGMLVAAQVIASQEILGFCRWIAAGGGLVREIVVDGENRVRLAVLRGGELRHERMNPEVFLHAVLQVTADLAGAVSGLELHEGRQVWAVATENDELVLGPFTVEDGTIQLGEYYPGTIIVGLWQAPEFETMPHYRILPNDEIVMRPGRIHTVRVNVMGTTSIAIGANGQPARNMPLARVGERADGVQQPFTGMVTRTGMLGAVTGTTLTITQTEPGRLRVRDFSVEEAL